MKDQTKLRVGVALLALGVILLAMGVSMKCKKGKDKFGMHGWRIQQFEDDPYNGQKYRCGQPLPRIHSEPFIPVIAN